MDPLSDKARKWANPTEPLPRNLNTPYLFADSWLTTYPERHPNEITIRPPPPPPQPPQGPATPQPGPPQPGPPQPPAPRHPPPTTPQHPRHRSHSVPDSTLHHVPASHDVPAAGPSRTHSPSQEPDHEVTIIPDSQPFALQPPVGRSTRVRFDSQLIVHIVPSTRSSRSATLQQPRHHNAPVAGPSGIQSARVGMTPSATVGRTRSEPRPATSTSSSTPSNVPNAARRRERSESREGGPGKKRRPRRHDDDRDNH